MAGPRVTGWTRWSLLLGCGWAFANGSCGTSERRPIVAYQRAGSGGTCSASERDCRAGSGTAPPDEPNAGREDEPDEGTAGSEGGAPAFASGGASGETNAGGARGGTSARGGAGGTSGQSVGGAAGSSGSTGDPRLPFLDCTSDDACPGGHCIEVWEGGFYACQTPPIEATECTGNSEDECCDSSECESTPCLSSDSYPWFGPDRPATFNLCGRESCVTDEDCTNDQVCLPGGVLGHPMSSCISALCRTDADCSEYANGLCAPVEDECYGGVAVFDCVYPGTGACRSNSDCSADSPPFELGESYCDSGRCVEVLQGSVCP